MIRDQPNHSEEPMQQDTAGTRCTKVVQQRKNNKIYYSNVRIRRKEQDQKLKSDINGLRGQYLYLQQQNQILQVKQFVLAHLLEARQKNIESQVATCKILKSTSVNNEAIWVQAPTGSKISVAHQQIQEMGSDDLNRTLELLYLEVSGLYPEAARQGPSSEPYERLAHSMSKLWQIMYSSKWEVIVKLQLDNLANSENMERQKRYWEAYKFTEQDILALSEVWSIQSDRLIKSYHERQNNDQPLVQHLSLLKQPANECQSPISLEKARKIQTKQFNKIKKGVEFEQNLIIEMQTMIFWQLLGLLRGTQSWLDNFPSVIDIFQIIQVAIEQGLQRNIIPYEKAQELCERIQALSQKLAAQQLL